MSVDFQPSPAQYAGSPQIVYRALSSAAVACLAISALSFVALLDWSLGVVPMVSIALGLVALRRIQKSPLELTGERLALAGILIASAFLSAGWMRLAWLAATEVPPGYQRLSFDELQPDPANAGQTVPLTATRLDGQRVFLKGYVFPGRERHGIKNFVLVRDNLQCCFGGNPKLTDMVEVKLAGNLAMDFTTNLRRVAGTFHVAPGAGIDGLPRVVYHLDADYLQ
jgi:hypothetical protein